MTVVVVVVTTVNGFEKVRILRIEGETRERERENSELDQFHSMVIMSAVCFGEEKAEREGSVYVNPTLKYSETERTTAPFED